MEIENKPKKVSLIKAVTPFIIAAAVVATGTILVVTIYFTLLDLAWIAFLAGVLFAAILAMVTQATRAEVTAARRAERLALVEDRLANETQQRESLAKQLAAARVRLDYSDESLPVMVAFVNSDSRYLYHNRAFRNWLGLPADKIDGQHLRDVLGRKVFAEIEAYVFQVAAGRIVHYERTHKMPDGTLCRLSEQYLPQVGDGGKFAGFYVLITDITEIRDAPLRPAGRTTGETDGPPNVAATEIDGAWSRTSSGNGMSDASVNTQASGWQDASQRILAAIEGNEFTLFCQRITPLARDTPGPGHYEVLIRLLEEESNLIPPGAFFALAEEHGLLPQLDRWVFAHVLDWMVTRLGAGTVSAGAIYFINIATATISDQDFPEFVEYQLRRTGVPAASVCIEITEPDLTLKQGDAVQFARLIRQCGCLIAISGFGRKSVPLETLKLFPVDFLKIDGSIVRQILTYPTYVGRAVAITRVAKAIGIRTVAEMVEDEGTLDMLRELKVDYAQGFGISRPQPLADLK